MRGRLRGCTIGTHSVKYEGTGSPHGSALLLPLETRLSRLRGWNRCDEDEERAARRGAWIFSRDLLPCRTDPRSTDERERERARGRSVSIPQHSVPSSRSNYHVSSGYRDAVAAVASSETVTSARFDASGLMFSAERR